MAQGVRTPRYCDFGVGALELLTIDAPEFDEAVARVAVMTFVEDCHCEPAPGRVKSDVFR